MANPELNIILMGPPAAGKGTQSELIVKEYGITHVSTGDMFRAAIGNRTKLGLEAKSYIDAGALVPDSVTIGLVRERLSEDDCRKGFLLDGFPRTVAQAEALKDMLKDMGRELTKVVLLVADDNVLIDRIANRLTCPGCGNSYNVKTRKPLVDGICDACGHELVHRGDDNAESFRVRLEAYHKQTMPLVDFYRREGLLSEVNALQDIHAVLLYVQMGER
jgi:adenylate kinase